MKRLRKQIAVSLLAQGVTLAVSTLLILAAPRLLGVENFGFWQLYLLYSSFAGFFHFGWNDGILLRYGGQSTDRKDRPVLGTQFWMLAFSQSAICGAFWIIAIMVTMESERKIIWTGVGLCIVLGSSRGFLWFLLQALGRIEEFARQVILDRLVFILAAGVLLAVGEPRFESLILADLLGKLITLLSSSILLRGFLWIKPSLISRRRVWADMKLNIGSGSQLMLANICGLLITGIIRFAIDAKWDIFVFGQVALALSISAILISVVTSLGNIAFLAVKRADPKRLGQLYRNGSTLITTGAVSLLLIYFPGKTILLMWLPDYAPAISYLAVVLPICVIEAKMAIVLIPFAKALRLETTLWRINMTIIPCSIALAALGTYLDSVSLTIAFIPLLLFLRASVLEWFISRRVGSQSWRRCMVELILIVLFILTATAMPPYPGLLAYSVILCVAGLSARRAIVEAKKVLLRPRT